MTKGLENFISNVSTAADEAGIFSCLAEAARGYGFDCVTYSLVTDHPSLGLEKVHGVSHNFPREWMDYYVRRNYFSIDPVAARHLQSCLPFFWSDVINERDKLTYTMMHEAGEAGLNDGIAIPIYRLGGEISSVAFARKCKSGNNSVEDLAVLQSIGFFFQEKYNGLFVSDTCRPLSPKAREVLSWAAEGLTDSQIANKLCISLATVRYHWNIIFANLETQNRTQSIARAIYRNLIQPCKIH